MPGDRALAMLIDIKARDSTSSVVRMLGGLFSGFAASLGQIGTAFKLFSMGAPITGMKALAEGIKGVMAASLELLGLITLVGAAIALALGVAAVKAAGNFQQGLSRLVTGAGDVTDNMNLMGQSILSVSTATGVLTEGLLPAMYQIISAGQRGAQAEDTLAVAARGSVIEQAKIVDVAKAITTAMKDYVTMHLSATQAMNGYIQAVREGKLTLEELATAMSPLLPIAADLGIRFSDVAAAMSTMTNAGLPADRAATSLRFLFQSLENPTKKASSAMTAFGLNTIAVADEMKKSLPGALQMIYDAAKRAGPEGSVPFNRAIADMIGGQRSLSSFLSLTGTHMADYRTNVRAVASAMDGTKGSVLGWADAQKNLNVKLSQVWASIQAVVIAVGTQLLPKLGPVADAVRSIAGHFADWMNNAQPISSLLDQIGAALGIVWPPAKQANAALAPLADTFDRASGSMHSIKSTAQPLLDTFDRASGVFQKAQKAANPFVPIFQGIASAFQWVKDTWNKLQPVFQFIGTTLAPLIQALGQVIQKVLVPAWNSFVNAVKPHLPELLQLAEVVGGILVLSFILVAGIILGVLIAIGLLVAGFLWLLATIISVSTWVHDKINWLVNQVVGFFKWLWKMLVGGSIIPDIVNGILSWFGKLKNELNVIVSFIIKWISDQWNNLVKAATSWGQGIINNLLAGLKSAWQQVVDWFTGALAWLKGLWPGSPVEHGPLKGYENWGYTFGMGIADGIRRSVPHVQSASALLAASMGGNYQGSYSLSGSAFGGGRYPTGGPTIVNVFPVVQPNDIYMDGDKLTDKIMRRAGTDVRRHGGPIKWG